MKVYIIKLTRVVTGTFVMKRFTDREKAFDYFVDRKLATANVKLEDKFTVELIEQAI
jgi:hypothetical protein